MRWMRPRGESISSLQSTYVGHVGRQKPQWTQSRRVARGSRGEDSVRVELAPDRSTSAAAGRASSPTPAARRPRTRRLRRGGRRPRRGRRASPRARPARSGAAPRARLAAAATRPRRDDVCLGAADERLRASRAAPRRRARDPSNSTATRPGWRTSSALGCSCERRSRADARAAASSVSTTSVRVAFGSGCRRKLARAISASRPSEPQTRRARS